MIKITAKKKEKSERQIMSIYNPNTPVLVPKAYYSLFLKRYSMISLHTHKRCEIMYIISGKAEVNAFCQDV